MLLFFILSTKFETRRKIEANKKIIINTIKEDSLVEEFIRTYPTIEDKLKKYTGTENLKSNQQYQKYLSEQRKILVNYLGTDYGDFEKAFFKYASPRISSSENSEHFNFISTLLNLQSCLLKHNITIIGSMWQEKDCTDLLTWNFESLCNTRLLSNLINKNKEMTLEELISETSLESPQTFLINLTASFYYDLLAINLKKILEERCKNYSIGRDAEIFQKQELNSENACLKTEIEKMKEELEKKEDACKKLKMKYEKELKNITHKYEEQARLLNKQMEKLKKTNYIQQGIPEKPVHADKLRNNNKDASTIKDNYNTADDITRLADKKILFLGGNSKLVKKLKKKFRNAIFIEKNTSSFPDKIDMAVILTKFNSHTLVEKFHSLSYESPEIEINSTNADMIIRQIMLNIS